MKKGSNIFILLFFFCFGCLLTYFSLQFSCLKINTEVNVIETLLSIGTALIGLYIAISIQKKNNRNQSVHSIVQTKMDNLWNEFTTFNNRLNHQQTIQLKITTKAFKNLYQNLNNIKIIFKTFNINYSCIETLEKSLEEFDALITDKLPISKNVINLSNNKADIKNQSTIIHMNIVDVLKKGNEIL